uniref:Putative ovule protein n=1 Tax=Solanum chacoense TaxID=4108 RepID=A0A0V0GSS7_SOLCH
MGYGTANVKMNNYSNGYTVENKTSLKHQRDSHRQIIIPKRVLMSLSVLSSLQEPNTNSKEV